MAQQHFFTSLPVSLQIILGAPNAVGAANRTTAINPSNACFMAGMLPEERRPNQTLSRALLTFLFRRDQIG
jgi:hypothetical protein